MGRKNDGIVINIPTERPWGGKKMQIKSQEIVLKILVEQSFGAKIHKCSNFAECSLGLRINFTLRTLTRSANKFLGRKTLTRSAKKFRPVLSFFPPSRFDNIKKSLVEN